MASRLRWLGMGVGLMALLCPLTGTARGQTRQVALAYVWQDTVTLADAEGKPLEQTGPTFTYGQGARLFWTGDGRTLYIARDDGLYATGAEGGAAVRMAGTYGRTLTLSQDGQTLYYLETVSPQPAGSDAPDRVAFPLRELNFALADGGVGRLTGYFGRFQQGASQAVLTFAAALYVRDGGLLGPGRPNLWPTYGANVFGTCCFPDPGLALYNTGTGDFAVYDAEFVPGAAALNPARTHLAGPTVNNVIRIYDLITGGWRDYEIAIAGGLGTIERVAWSPDNAYLFFVSRYAPSHPLTLDKEPTFPVDVRSADIVLYRLNLVNGTIRELASRADVYGVSSLAVTDRYAFAVVVDPNIALVNDLNTRRVWPGAKPTDPEMRVYLPATHLWRVAFEGGGAEDVAENVWGVAARPY